MFFTCTSDVIDAIFGDEIIISDDKRVYDGCLVQVGDSTVLSGVG